MSRHHTKRYQRGVAALEFAFVFLLGILPLLLLTLSGVMIFAAQQSLTLAASEGARAALHYGSTAQRQTAACSAAQSSMQWLLNFSGESANCAAPQPPGSTYQPIAVSSPATCPSNAAMSCITVVASYDYKNRPLIPLAGALFVWLTGPNLSSSATVQLDLSGSY
ncbi:TadE/TadG family type IV pilus assembly protein [Dyella sp. ASV21]|uniref:TadE/TadG family type IV pilus assembly protein n=1 Tax=Dyella sp. ASV21 TaxID=2795114 RepID=UPI0018EC2312|nr:TadE/TadG family type IV pilus assembly protein [Dyella sp. ASV21]